MSYYFLILLISSFITSLFLAIFLMPRIIYIATKNRYLDTPDNERKVHDRIITNLGGIGIYMSFIVVSLFSSITLIKINDIGTIPFFQNWYYFVISTFILFITGVKDDLAGLSPFKKFVAQAVAAFIVVYFADIRLLSFHGIFGIQELPYLISILFSIIGIIFVTNAFNLIDGIDGLAGSLAALILAILSILFTLNKNYNEAIISITLLGAVLGFLKFNIAPARIFMGDTGSLGLGGALASLAILSRTELLLVLIGGIFVIVTGSVVIQRVFFKLTKWKTGTGKRVFLMSPLHHHFELKGWAQITVVVRFWIIAGLCVLSGIGLFYIEWIYG